MNLTYLRLELKRLLRDPASMFFTAVLPCFFYIVFGATQEWGDERAGNGNVRMVVMISMAAYGAVTATVSIGGRSAMERMQGWGRQIGLTPMRDGEYVVIKALVAMLVAAVPVGLIYFLGAVTGAEGPASAWVLSALAIVLGSTVFAVYGLICALAFRSEAALSAATGSVVLLSFLGNIFFPLSGTLLTIAKFTPLYGYVALARHPVTEGLIGTDQGPVGSNGTDPLWLPLLNLGVWSLVIGATATWLMRRGRERQ